MVKDGKVYGVLYDEEPCVVASESQLKKLTKAGIRWSYATKGKNDGGNTKAAQPQAPRPSSVRATRHRT